MSLLGILLNPFRSALGASIKTVFEEEVRHNPTIIDADTQSDDRVGYSKEQKYGFAPQYVVPFRRPKTDVEAQRLYNHIRTVSWYLDAIPLLGRKLPFNIGVESIVGIIPGVGDWIGFLFSLYTLVLYALFGLPLVVMGMMVANIVIDTVIGLIPIVGDMLDVAFKSNLRNLRLMEDHMIKTRGQCSAGQFRLSFPPSNVFLAEDSPIREQPMPNVSSSSSSQSATSSAWSRFGFGGGNRSAAPSPSTRQRPPQQQQQGFR